MGDDRRMEGSVVIAREPGCGVEAVKKAHRPRLREDPGPGHSDSPMNSAVEQLGKYELVQRLASGGMAELYLASQV